MEGETKIYAPILERIFERFYKKGATKVDFERTHIEEVANELGINLPKNPGDVIYAYRYRRPMPDSIQRRAPGDRVWIIRGRGRSKYRFAAVSDLKLEPNTDLAEVMVPDATPGIIATWALTDEQALLAKLRYNRLIDIFTGITSYSLQNHLRTYVADLGQTETDEVYIGLDQHGAQYIFPVQAKGGNGRLSVVQIEQDFAMCAEKFPDLICRPIAAQFIEEDQIALFSFKDTKRGVKISSEKHFVLVPYEEISKDDLAAYRMAAPDP